MEELDIYTIYGLEQYEDDSSMNIEDIGFMQGYIEAFQAWFIRLGTYPAACRGDS